jgi:hypothetical protein
MFQGNGYRIIETKEEFLKDWNTSWKRYDHAVMPDDFSLDKTTFPMALYYYEPWDYHCCGNWAYVSLEKAAAEILKTYQENIDYFTERVQKLKQF